MLHLGGVGKYVSQIQGWFVHPWESGDLHYTIQRAHSYINTDVQATD